MTTIDPTYVRVSCTLMLLPVLPSLPQTLLTIPDGDLVDSKLEFLIAPSDKLQEIVYVDGDSSTSGRIRHVATTFERGDHTFAHRTSKQTVATVQTFGRVSFVRAPAVDLLEIIVSCLALLALLLGGRWLGGFRQAY